MTWSREVTRSGRRTGSAARDSVPISAYLDNRCYRGSLPVHRGRIRQECLLHSRRRAVRDFPGRGIGLRRRYVRLAERDEAGCRVGHGRVGVRHEECQSMSSAGRTHYPPKSSQDLRRRVKRRTGPHRARPDGSCRWRASELIEFVSRSCSARENGWTACMPELRSHGGRGAACRLVSLSRTGPLTSERRHGAGTCWSDVDGCSTSIPDWSSSERSSSSSVGRASSSGWGTGIRRASAGGTTHPVARIHAPAGTDATRLRRSSPGRRQAHGATGRHRRSDGSRSTTGCATGATERYFDATPCGSAHHGHVDVRVRGCIDSDGSSPNSECRDVGIAAVIPTSRVLGRATGGCAPRCRAGSLVRRGRPPNGGRPRRSPQ